MKSKYVVSMLLLVTLVALAAFTRIEIGKASSPTIYVSPDTKNVQLGEEFAIDIDIDYVTNLYGYEVWLSFDNTKLNATDIEYRGFLNEPSMEWPTYVNNTGGYATLARSSQKPALPKTGGSPPALATVHFEAIGTEISTLHFTKTRLWNSEGVLIPSQTLDGTVRVGAQPVGGNWIAPNKLELLAPWIILVSVSTTVVVAAVLYKHRKKKQ